LRNDPEVKTKLQQIAATDPYVAPASDNPSRFRVRDAASYALGQLGGDWFKIVRNADTRACRLEPESSDQADPLFIGPIDGRFAAEQELCIHLDTAAKDPSLCWTISPQNVCRERR
jgi:hypothetical protein